MATFTATAAQTNSSGFFLSPPKYNEKGVQARTVQYIPTVAESAGDVWQVLVIPKGAVVLDGYVQVAGHTGGNGTFAVGDSGAAARFGSLSYSVSGVLRFTQGLGYSYSADTVIQISNASVTTGTATGTVRLCITYAFDQAADGNSGSN